ncbi:MAG TPA: DUF6351 family protein [Bryobacteraceae bacterium]|nr:DUF6351 family protein [Bryobacteraceae bacterium]
MSIRPCLLTLCIASTLAVAAPASLTVASLSSRPEFVSGGDVLLEVKTAVPSQKVQVKVNGRDVSAAFHRDLSRGSLVGLVDGLRSGANTVTAKAGSENAHLELTNHPITGPILSGEHLKPFVCNTEESGLGKPLDADCSAAPRIEYFYRSTSDASTLKPLPDPAGPRPADLAQTTTTSGQTVPYIVRMESGTINRAIFHIAILDDPARAGTSPWTPGPAWNRRIVYTFGGGCGTNYNQGKSPASAGFFNPALSRGFAHITSSQNVLQQHCNDNLSGEALMMIKEYFIKHYGVPAWTMGFGGSGGSIQQLLIGQNFPGLLDGLLPSLTFPDSVSISPDVNECRLLVSYFKRDPNTWTKDKETAVEGYSAGTCAAWDRSFANTIVAANTKGCGIAPELTYDPVKNPKGARCTIWDTNVATYGRDPATGFARTPMDNIGVQYGLKALNDGVIGKQEFLDLNRNIGGFDRDGIPRSQRSSGDPEAIRLAYAAGRIDQGGGGLASVPILHFRSYNDAMGDIHDHVRDFVMRERLRKANGRADNQVIWVYPNGNRPLAANVVGTAIDIMSQWLDTLAQDRSGAPAADKVAYAKPAAAVDGCWANDGSRIDEPATLDGPGKCNGLYPAHLTPRLVAGAPLTDDVMKCQLKPVDPRDYKAPFTAPELAELSQVFPGGVCDYSKPGVMQVPLAGTYLSLPLEIPASQTVTHQ